MFKNPILLDRRAHHGLQLSPNQPYHHAAQLMATPVVAGEAALVAREYVLVFGKQPGTLPLALLGVEKGRNAYVRPSGQWQARYIPAHIRRYPFVLADRTTVPNGEGERNFVLLFDRDAPHLKGDKGMPLFTEAGEPAPALQTVQQVLTTLQRDNKRTLSLVAQIETAGLLHERVLQAKPRQRKSFALDGMRSVDTEKFAALPAETLLTLHQSGALALIHAHLLSLSNLNDGPLRRDAPADQAPELFGDETISLAGLGLVKPH